jgi:hypothetical protein
MSDDTATAEAGARLRATASTRNGLQSSGAPRARRPRPVATSPIGDEFVRRADDFRNVGTDAVRVRYASHTLVTPPQKPFSRSRSIASK